MVLWLFGKGTFASKDFAPHFVLCNIAFLPTGVPV